MLSESSNITGTSLQKIPFTSEQIDADRKIAKDSPERAQKDANKVPAEELLTRIKALTEDGLYSVRFENDERTKQMVVKIVDSETQEVIRQVPAKELLGTRAALAELQGNIVDTTS